MQRPALQKTDEGLVSQSAGILLDSASDVKENRRNTAIIKKVFNSQYYCVVILEVHFDFLRIVVYNRRVIGNTYTTRKQKNEWKE